MKKYRVSFSKGPDSDQRLKYDIEAETSDEAFSKAYQYLKSKDIDSLHSDSTIEEWPDGASNIGIRFKYYDGTLKREFSQYMIIHADNEIQAVEFYNSKFKGKHFYQPYPHRIEENGNCEYRAVAETYFAACPGAHYDATKAKSLQQSHSIL